MAYKALDMLRIFPKVVDDIIIKYSQRHYNCEYGGYDRPYCENCRYFYNRHKYDCNFTRTMIFIECSNIFIKNHKIILRVKSYCPYLIGIDDMAIKALNKYIDMVTLTLRTVC